MKGFVLNRFARVLLLTFALVVAGVSQGGCENRPKTEVVGFPPSFADLAEKVKPAVVNISTTKMVKVPGNPFRQFFGHDDQGPFGDFFRHYFNDVPDREMKQQSLGSGFIIDRDGYIVTNNHVVDEAQEIKVKLSDGREMKAKVIGRDSKTDLALIKISSPFENLPVLKLGDSDSMRVGDWVMAVGNPFGLAQTVTQGIISATGRVIGSGPYDDFLQTDAPINPGNSGGPLVNLKGEVVGINTAIVPGGQGLGFAIPSNLAKTVVAQIREHGKVVRGWLGVTIQSVTPELAKSFGLKEAKGALVSDVAAGGPAEAAGVKQGDVIVRFNGKSVDTSTALPRMVAETPVGSSVPLTVMRGRKEVTLTVRIAELTEEKLAAQSGGTEQTLGMKVGELTPRLREMFGIRAKSGVVVLNVEQGSVAEEAGIEPGDVIVEVNRKRVKGIAEYRKAMAEAKKGAPILFLINRKGQGLFVTIEQE